MPLPSDANPASISETAERTYGGVAIRGMMWLGLSIAVARVAAFGSTLALGWLLAKPDFAVYGLALAIQAMTAALRDGGASIVLIQRGRDYERLVRPVLTLAFFFNAIAAILLVVAAKPVSAFFDSPRLVPLLWISAIGIMMNSPVVVIRARLSIDLRFRMISRINALSALVRHTSLVVFALILPGESKVLCFALPQVIVPVFEMIAGGLAVRGVPWRMTWSWPAIREIFTDARWIMVGAFATSIILQGDKLIFGKFVPEAMFAIYFFGWQLTGAVATPITTTLPAVLMPTLSQLSHDRPRQTTAFLKAVRMLPLMTAVICVGAAVAARPAVEWFWQGKWDEAIPVVQFLSLALITRMLAPLGRALIEAQGRWRLRALMLAVDSVGTLIAGVIGAMLGDLISLVITVMIYRSLIGLVQAAVAGMTIGLPPWRTLSGVPLPVVSFLACGAATSVIVGAIAGGQAPWVQLILTGAVYGGLALVAALTIMRPRTMEVWAMVRSRGRRGHSTPVGDDTTVRSLD